VWDLAKRTPLGQRFLHRCDVTAAVLSPDGKTVLTGCEDGAARLWDVETGTLHTAPLLLQSCICAVAFSPDGTIVLAGGNDGNVRLWDAASGMPLGPPIPHPDAVVSVAFSRDGNNFLTGCDDQGVRLFRKVSELPNDLDRIATWVEVLTGLTLDAEHGRIQPLDTAAWQERRRQLERRGGAPETAGGPKLDPIPFGTDPIARARVLIERGQWDEAEAAFDEVVRARPYNAASWSVRGAFRVARGQPERATADLAYAIRLTPEDLRIRSFHALSLLAQGDQACLRQACSDLLGRFGAMNDPYIDGQVAWICVLGPDSLADPAVPVRLTERALKLVPATARPAYLNTLGAALYRARRFDESIRRLEESIRTRGDKSLPQDWVFLALAHQRLGHRAEALRWLDRFRTYQATEKPDTFWDELEIRLLRNEAEAVVLSDPVFPVDAFAR
jgi:tetratricopeptide (TPR) repeat protein